MTWVQLEETTEIIYPHFTSINQRPLGRWHQYHDTENSDNQWRTEISFAVSFIAIGLADR
jgi:hypothetical protein